MSVAVPPDREFAYVYEVQDNGEGVYTVVDANARFSGFQGVASGVDVVDTKDGASDNQGVLGDGKTDDNFAIQFEEVGDFAPNQSFTFVGTVASVTDIKLTGNGPTVNPIPLPSNASEYGFVALLGNKLYLFTDVSLGKTTGIVTLNVNPAAEETICFMAGTLIRTPSGEVPVESLKRGDLVLTNDGREIPVCWLGRQTVSTVFADKLRVLPIRIKAGALGENVPSRDLLVSPDHALLVEGALIHGGALVNGSSVVRETNVPRTFTYYHVEVDDHSLILAENTPAETFVDNVDRLAFDNWAEHEALYTEGKAITELPYPRAKAHRQVPVSTRVKLAERARLIGALVDQADVA